MDCSVRTVKGKQSIYLIGQLVGEGQFGRVYRGHSEDGGLVAIKIIRRNKFIKNQKLKHLIQREMQILSDFAHENVIALVEVIVDNQDVYIIYQYCEGGTLEDRIPLPKDTIFSVFSQMVHALSQAQQKGIIHRDLKPANILFKGNKVKIADWGFSRLLENGQTTSSFIGSPAYMAPEVLKGELYTNKADIWSLGVLLYQTFTASCPWKSSNISSLCQEIKKNVISFPKDKDIPKFWKDIIVQMLQVSPSQRPTWKQLQQQLSNFSKTQLKENNDENEQLKIMSCVFFLQIVQWSRKNLINLTKFDYCIKLVQKNLLHLKSQSKKSTQLIHILQKEIRVVSSLKSKINIKIMSKKTLSQKKELLKTRETTQQNPQGEWQELIKKTVRYVIDDLQMIYKDREVEKREGRLIQLNILLDLIVFPEIPSEYLKKPLDQYVAELSQINKKGLLKLINYKLQIVNKKYYQ